MILTTSITLNILLAVYVVWLLRKMWVISESFGTIFDSLDHFANHLKSIHELEIFYGDETLAGLIEHSKEVVSETFGSIFDSLSHFSNHIKSIHELEMFYGDETLAGLMEHSKEIISDIETLQVFYSEEGIEEGIHGEEETEEE